MATRPAEVHPGSGSRTFLRQQPAQGGTVRRSCSVTRSAGARPPPFAALPLRARRHRPGAARRSRWRRWLQGEQARSDGTATARARRHQSRSSVPGPAGPGRAPPRPPPRRRAAWPPTVRAAGPRPHSRSRRSRPIIAPHAAPEAAHGMISWQPERGEPGRRRPRRPPDEGEALPRSARQGRAAPAAGRSERAARSGPPPPRAQAARRGCLSAGRRRWPTRRPGPRWPHRAHGPSPACDAVTGSSPRALERPSTATTARKPTRYTR